MAIYSIMQCSVCRRTKDVLQDNIHAAPNQCTITKGCSGFLFPTGETTNNTPTPLVDGLTDWYPRGQKPVQPPAAPVEQMIDMSTSSAGSLTLALSISDVEANANLSVVALFEQQLSTTIPYSLYIFSVTPATPSDASTTTISGKDSTGKNLRFTSEDANTGLVVVLINGIASFNGFAPDGWHPGAANQIITNSRVAIGSVVTVSVYNKPPTVQVPLVFTLNSATALDSNLGSWGNVRWVQGYEAATGNIETNKWWLYTCTTTNAFVSSARLRLIAIYTDANLNVPILPTQLHASDYSGIRFLLAGPPYDNADRYLNFFIDGNLVAGNYAFLTVTSKITELFADSSTMNEVYPPFQLYERSDMLGSFVVADTFSTTDSLSSTTPETRISGKKIIGPV